MLIKLLRASTAAVLIGLASVNTQEASIWLEPTNQTINVGGVARLELWADASDVGGFLVGGLDLFYDYTILFYNDDLTFISDFPIGPNFSYPGVNCYRDITIPGCTELGEINGIAFSEFNGPALVGTLSFTGVSVGVSPLTMTDNDFPGSGWFATDGSALFVEYGNAEIHVVPLPAAAWLMISGLGLMLGFTRQRKT